MERADEVIRLLEEIRDDHRSYFAHAKATQEQALAENRLAAERAQALYTKAARDGRTTWMALMWLIAICVGANLFILIQFAQTR